jgi:hypothetical protein
VRSRSRRPVCLSGEGLFSTVDLFSDGFFVCLAMDCSGEGLSFWVDFVLRLGS